MCDFLSILFCILLFVYYAFVLIGFFQRAFETKKEFYTALIPFGLLIELVKEIFKGLK